MNNGKGQKLDKDSLTRRKLFGKYGVYRASVVVSILVPSKAYPDNPNTTTNVYSNTTSCLIAHAGGGNPANHCSMMHGL